ncbi:phage portal protein [Methylocystis sp. ATCC 49242]|uniref:phage portal protein n=1 Tax=Methylocystis sp. ATCC 49242 TaxID=622637 RepID=UPI0001F8884E|nr:phage portal protein [Methylocystis sp. ATCC 49242]
MTFPWGRIAQFLGVEKRAAVPADAFLAEYFGARGVGAGAVSADQVLSNLAIATACVSRRSQGLASVPLNIHRNIGPSNAERAEDHQLYDILNVRPNEYQSGYEFREFMGRSHDVFGNAYARIERDARGQIVALHPFLPAMVAIERLASGRLRYRATDWTGKVWTLLQEEMLHIRGPSRDGIYGLSPIQIARGSVSLALAQSETAQSFMSNGLPPSALVMPPIGTKYTEVALQKLQRGFAEYQSGRNAGKVIVAPEKMEITPFNWTPEDSEFLDNRKLSNEDVARIFDCPPTSVGIVDRSTYSNTEQEALALVRNCLAPLASRFESAFARCLLTNAGRRSYFFRHDFSELLRGDMKTRFEAYRLARETGVYSPNDVRRLENEAPVAGGDVYHMPANWTQLGQPQSGAPQNATV